MRKKSLFIKFCIFQILVTPIIFVLLLFYGPFYNVKSSVTYLSCDSMNYTWIAKIFLSDEAIKRIVTLKASDTISDNVEAPKNDLFNTQNYSVFNINDNGLKGKAVLIKDPTKIEVGYTKFIGIKGQSLSAIAKRNKAMAAINGGGFVDKNQSGTGGIPTGVIIHKGNFICNVPYDSVNRTKLKSVIGFTNVGKLIIGKYYKRELVDMKVTEALSFDAPYQDTPALILDGKATRTNSPGFAPRSAIGQKKDGTVIFLTLDSENLLRAGATFNNVRQVFIQLGAVNAAILDGGHSTTIFFDGKVIMKNSRQPVAERYIASAFLAK